MMTGGSPICRKRPVVFCPSAELFHIWIQRAIIDGAPARVDIGFLSSNGRTAERPLANALKRFLGAGDPGHFHLIAQDGTPTCHRLLKVLVSESNWNPN